MNIQHLINPPVAKTGNRIAGPIVGSGIGGGGGGGLAAAVLSVEYAELQVGGNGNPKTRTQNLTKGQIAENCIWFTSYYWTDGGDTSLSELHSNSARVFDNSGTAAIQVISNANFGGNGVTVGVFAVEMNPDVMKVQQFNGTMTGVTTNKTLGEAVSSLNYAFGCAFFTPTTSTSSVGWDSLMARCRLTSTSNFRIERGAHDTSMTYYGWVVEDLTEGDYFQVQSVAWQATGVTSAEQEYTQSITAVGDVNATMVIGSVYPTNDFDPSISIGMAKLNSDSQVAFFYGDGNTGNDPFLHAYVVEWFDGTTVQRGTKNYTSTGAVTQSITEVDLDRAVVIPGKQGGIGGAAIDRDERQKALVVVDFSDSSTLRFYSGPSVANAENWVPWEVVEFPAAA